MSEALKSQWRQLLRFRWFNHPQVTPLADPTVPVGSFPTAVAITPNGLTAYVTNEGDNTVSVISTATNTVTATIPVGSVPFWVAITPNGLTAYVTNSGDNTVSVISTATNTVTTTIPVGSVPLGVAIPPNGLTAYVTNSGDNTVSVIDTATNTVTATIPVGTAPFGVAITPNGLTAYVTNSGDNTVSVISTATNTVTATIPVGTAPFGVAITPNGLTAYIANNGDNTVSVISTATNTVTATIPVGTAPLGVAIPPNGLTAYITNNGDNTVSVIDTATNTVTATIPVGTAPFGVAITPDGLTAYIANNGDNTVSVTPTAPFATTTTLTSAPDPSVFGQPKTLTATVTSTVGTPTGTVSFFDGATLLGTATLTGGVATFSVSTLSVGSHSLTAVYNGDASFTGSTSPIDTQTVTQAATTTALTSAPDPSVFGQPKTLTATVTAVPPGAGTPTGTVSFFDGATLLGTATLTVGVATFTTSALGVGSHSLTAVYGGDVDFTGSTSPIDVQTVTQAGTTTALTSAPDPSVFGQPKTLTATVTAVPPGAGTPTGTVSFFDGATLLGTATLTGGVATFATSALGVGSHSLTAVYNGDVDFSGSTSPVDVQTVTQAGTSTALTSAPDPSVFGQPKTLTATVTAVLPGAGTPTGTVDFFDGATLLGTATLSGGVATFTTSTLSVGSHSLTAVYNGDVDFSGSTSPIDVQTVTQAGTSTALTSAPDPSVFGQAKTLTATVTAVLPGAGTPTGTVDFFDGATLLGTATLSGGVATFTTSTLSVGSHSLTAVYGGDVDFTGSTSAVDVQTVTQAGTTTALTSVPDPSVFGQPKTLTATVTAVPPGAGTPTGTVSFFDGATLLGTATLTGGVATLTTSTLSVGSHSLTAVYNGDVDFSGSTSPVDVQTVTQAGTSTALTSAPDPSVFGQAKTLTATVTAVPPGAGTPTGTVSFFDGATILGTATLTGGVATLTTSTLSVGSHSLTAVYNGDVDFTGSTSPVDVQTVTQATTSTALTSAPDPSVFGQAKTLTATVTAVPPGAGTPTGTVSFFDGATLLGTATLTGGVATLTTSTLSVGSHSLTAVYNGDVDFTGSTSPVDVQTVTQAGTTTALTSAPDPSVFGQPKILTATVAAVLPGAGTPTGTVSFFDGAILLGTATLSGGVATFATSALGVGSHFLTAVYNGDVDFSGSTSPVDVQTVTQAGTTTALTSAPDPSVFGQPKTLTATVAAVPPGGGTPTGTVSFFDGATLLGTATLSGGVATFATSALGVGSHSLTAVYNGDVDFSGSTSPVDVQTVTQAGTSTALTSAPDPSVFGQAKTLTATVTAVLPGAGTPTGTVDFFDGAILLGTATLSGGVATFATSALGVGSHSLTAVYGGDVDFTGSTSPIDVQTVTQAGTTTALTSVPDPSVFGQPKTLTATVAAVLPGAGTPTGTVDFFDGAALLGTATLSGGVATFTTSSLGVGSHLLTAVYNGDVDFSGSTSPVDVQTVTQAGTTTALTSAPDPSVFGQPKTLTATVAAVPPGGGTPTGTVSFFDGVTLLGTATLSGGVATFTTSTLSVGSHSLTAVYNGDVDFSGSTSPVDVQTVTQAGTTTALTSAPDPSVFGQAKTLTATVAAVLPGAGTPTGTVSFFDGATLLGTATLSGGAATFTTSTLSVGSHSLTAVYGGDVDFTGSTSPVDIQTVTQAATTTVLTSAPDPSVFGQAKTLTATVTAVLPGAGTPTGTVSFFDGATLLGTATLSGGVATFTTSTLSVGSHSLTAVYGGDVDFSGSTSPVDTQTVTQAGTTTVLTSAPDPSIFGQPKTLTATVTAVPPGAGTPTGTVDFFDGATLLGTTTLSGGVATFTTSTLGVGSHSLTAVYGGDVDFNGSTSPVDVQTVNKAGTSTVLASAPDPSVFGQAKTLTATVTAVLPGAGTPTGTVSFFDGATLLGAATLSGGVATFTTSTLSVGSHSLTAVYNGDASFNGSTSPVDTQSVSKGSTTTAVGVSPDPTVFGQPKTLTATVTPVAPAAGVPSGTVTFFVGGVPQAPVSVVGGVATFTTSTLPVGPRSVRAAYNGDASFTGSTSPTITETVNKAGTSTVLASAPDPSVFGQAKTLTATVTAVAPGGGTATGTVSFFDGVTLLGTATLSGGVATFTTSTLSVGSHSLTAVYNGSGSFNTSTSPVDTQTVNKAGTSTVLASAPDPSVFGQAKTLTATVTAVAPGGGTATGTVSFFDGATLLGTATLSGGVATFSVSTLSVGSHSLTAVYGGDVSFTGSTSPVDVQTVNKAGTSTVLASAPDPSVFGQAKTLTATVTAVLPGAGTPTGTVSFFDGATLLGAATLSGGVATFTTSTLSVGSHSLTAVYNGDASFNGSTSPVDTQSVSKGSTTTAVGVSPDPTVFGQPKTLTATVTPVAPAAGVPSGTVTFFVGGVPQAPVSVVGGVATFTTSTLPVGPRSVRAAYNGDASFTGSTSPTITETVNKAATTTALTSAPNPSTSGQPVTLTATVAAVPPGAGTSTGAVSFFDGVTLLGTATLSGGVATFSISTLSVGSHSLTAVYNGSGTFNTSTSPVDTQTVM
ncbi:Ig-like domain repeat protein [Streptomyces scopuliridis]|uniref:Ig-like domain repeat protein n=1 Tax=Streptomyces scopuliridis TaxID=452529 RepID=UPI002DDB2115|nr:Ig-like domain repeat protein [Streptomyces scopuliridis]WSB31552.1 Ig-like domain repeat protein [Streptomyces scopuliridis]